MVVIWWMPIFLHMLDQVAEQNCVPLSVNTVAGTLNLDNQRDKVFRAGCFLNVAQRNSLHPSGCSVDDGEDKLETSC